MLSYTCSAVKSLLMNKFLRSFITIEKTFQIVALVGVTLFLGYVGLNHFQRDRIPSVPEIPQATQLN
jgi:hypothetical protein